MPAKQYINAADDKLHTQTLTHTSTHARPQAHTLTDALGERYCIESIASQK